METSAKYDVDPASVPDRGSAPDALSFAVLGQRLNDPDDADIGFQMRREAHWAARKACAILKTTSAIVNAIVVHPGADCDEDQLVLATRELMQRAARLTDAAMELLDVQPDHRLYAGYRNLVRQQAAEVVATQWRMANGAGAKELSVERIAGMFKAVLSEGQIDNDGELPPYPKEVDFVTAKRLAVLGVVPDIYNAVNSFDYFVPDPESLVANGVGHVVAAADEGIRRIAAPGSAADTMTMLTQSLIGKAGSLYAANYRAQARRDVLALQRMDPTERRRHIYVHRDAGLPHEHLGESFSKVMRRMVDMVCEAVPELAQEQTAPAQVAQPRIETSAAGRGARQNESKPE